MWINWANPCLPPSINKKEGCKCTTIHRASDCDKCEPGIPYDLEAIKDVRPDHVILTMDYGGSGGSYPLISWLTHTVGAKPVMSNIAQLTSSHSMSRYETMNKYKEIERMTIFADKRGATAEYTIIWLSKLDVEPTPKLLKLVAKHKPTPPEPTAIDQAYANIHSNQVTGMDLLTILMDSINMMEDVLKRSSKK